MMSRRLIFFLAGIGLIATIVFVTKVTVAQAPAPVVTNITTTAITDNTAKVHWNTDILTCGRVDIINAVPNVSPAITVANPVTVEECQDYINDQLASHDVQLTGLKPGTVYTYNIVYNLPCGTNCSAVTTASQPFKTSGGGGNTDVVTITSITAVNIESTNSTSATINFSYSSPLKTGLYYQVQYGTGVKYNAKAYENPQPLSGSTGNKAFAIPELDNSTNYHFSIQILDGDTDAAKVIATSADRTFSTARDTSGPAPFEINKIRVDCINNSCTIFFTTNIESSVEVKWKLDSFDNFEDPSLPSVSETGNNNGSRALLFPNLPSQAELRADTKYYYRLRGTSALHDTTMTGPLTFRTSASAHDHTFATGQCTYLDPGPPPKTTSVDVGGCIGNQYCAVAGNLVLDCTKCGHFCDAKSTCRASTPAFCTEDASTNLNSSSQCNESACYGLDGRFLTPAAAKCYSSWPRCNANTILKVQKDRGCNLWLSCATSIQTEATQAGPADNLCLNLGACNSLNSKGQCNHYLAPGQCSNDPLRFCSEDEDCFAGGTCNNPNPDEPTKALQDVTYQTPKDVGQIANLSGNVLAGLDWGSQGGANVIQGGLPWQLMRQVGGNAQLLNGDFEYQAPSVTPWIAVPSGITPSESIKVDFEERDAGPNHVLVVDPVIQSSGFRCTKNASIACTAADDTTSCTKKRCSNDLSIVCTDSTSCTNTGTCTDPDLGPCAVGTVDAKYSGAASGTFIAQETEYYYAEARIRSVGGARVRMQFGFNGYTTFQVGDVDTFVDVDASSAWQRVTLGPLRGLVGETRLAFVCASKDACTGFQIDDVVVKPVLQTSTNPSYLTPSCRLYPKNDSPACDYQDTNGVLYKGWKGYCLEHDSQTGTCLSWWPVDVIKGESNIFGSEKSVGYQDRTPLFLCAEGQGDPSNTYPYRRLMNNMADGNAVQTRNFWRANCDDPDDSNCDSQSHPDTSLPGLIGGEGGGWWPSGENQTSSPATDPEAVETVSGGTAFDLKGENLYESQIYAVGLTNTFGVGGLDQKDTPTYLTRGTSYTGGCDDLYRGLPYSFCIGGGPGKEYWTVHFEFGVSGKLLRVWQKGLDDNNLSGGAAAQVYYIMKDQCSTLVQVVDSSGSTSAYASRISSSNYKIPDLNYGLSTDLKPFGGALAPIPPALTNDPTTWGGLINAELPNYGLTKTPPGQARSGSPYACNGACANVACSLDAINTCVGSDNIRKCQEIDVTGDGKGDGQCVGVGSAVASNKMQQLFSPTLSCIEVGNSSSKFCGGKVTCGTPVQKQCSATKDVTATGITAWKTWQQAANLCGFTAAPPTTWFNNPVNYNVPSVDASSDSTPQGVACDGSTALCSGTKAYYDVFQSTTKVSRRFSADFFNHYEYLDCKDSTGNPIPIDQCESDFNHCTCQVTGACSVQIQNSFYNVGTVDLNRSGTPCQTDAECQSRDNKAYFAMEHIKRVFTKSLGLWTNNACSGDNSIGCFSTSDCFRKQGADFIPKGECNKRLQKYVKVNSSIQGATPQFTGWVPPTEMCQTNPASLGLACSSAPTACSASASVTGTALVASNASSVQEAAARSEAIKAALGQCGLKLTSADPVIDSSRNVTNAVSDLKVDPDPKINGTPKVVACNGVSKECPGVTNSYAAGTVAPYTSLKLSNACSKKDGTMTCTGICTSTKSYILAGKTDASKAPKFLRPPYDATSSGDYCAIPPSISNASFVTGAATTATINGGSGSVAIKFNTNADAEQIPLSKIIIDWGDAQDPIDFPYAPRTDVSHPHIFSHTYSVNRSDTIHCKPYGFRTTCAFPIKIQIKDSWGWCSDASRDTVTSTAKTSSQINAIAPQPAEEVPTITTQCHNTLLGNGRFDSTKWYNTGLVVNVQP